MPSDNWRKAVEQMAVTTGKTFDELSAMLLTLTGGDGDEELALLQNDKDTPTADIKVTLASLNIPLAKLNSGIRQLRGPESATPKAGAADIAAIAATPALTAMILPEVPAGLSLLQRLRVGGVLKVKVDTLVSAVRVLFTERAGFFDIVDRLSTFIEERAEKNGRSVPPIFLKLESLTRTDEYAAMLNVLKEEGILDRRRYASKGEKEKLLRAIEPIFGEFAAIQTLLEGYLEQMTMGGGNPQLMMQGIFAAMSGQPNPALALMMQPPEPTTVIAAIGGLADRINRMFAGTRSLTAAALQPDVAAVASILDNDELYAALGTTDRDEMLNEIGLAASIDLVQIEINILKYMVAVLEIPNRDSQSQPMYIGTVAMLGKQIPWSRLEDLSHGRVSGNGFSNGRPAAANAKSKGGSSSFPGQEEESRRRY